MGRDDSAKNQHVYYLLTYLTEILHMGGKVKYIKAFEPLASRFSHFIDIAPFLLFPPFNLRGSTIT